ncbi:hypothetical protein RhiirC2_792355 [Rhizophagus irregularis]|uniref:Uncharacterized protein n=1 Tax=Rhizophagus irregularis TaxID=588596 RepID=A0A2N1MHH6_9GLOM|nr:hypothetical protein RhiirC2_792355 [Rhizophagus irregularis]
MSKETEGTLKKEKRLKEKIGKGKNKGKNEGKGSVFISIMFIPSLSTLDFGMGQFWTLAFDFELQDCEYLGMASLDSRFWLEF